MCLRLDEPGIGRLRFNLGSLELQNRLKQIGEIVVDDQHGKKIAGWWARQPPYETAFLEGFLSLIKILIQRVPTKIPTKLPRGRRSVRRPYAQSPAALWSSIASDRTTKVARSLSGRESIFEVGPARADRLLPWRALAGRRKVSSRWDERFESLLYCVDLEARVSRLSTVDFPQECK